ncbi:hypothetical protein ABIC83_001927 [Roseateles asaccharophilus]|uniref:Uncharacterized protein n=1 Tax=Roseateles asaccharophilus TaxID=582607 RepID=A0ABU2A4L6_9BURK|nr:hypothetical protein [Roseateles asaccharophilus]
MLRIFQQLGVYFLLTLWSYAVQAAESTPVDVQNSSVSISACVAEL